MASSKEIKSKEEVIAKCREVHGDFYNYDKIEYVNNRTKMCIICPEHGEYWQNYKNHVTLGKGCPVCGRITAWNKRHCEHIPKQSKEIKKYKKCYKVTYDVFLERAHEIHGNKYDYSKVNYIDSKTPICIICPEHGEFWQVPYNHLLGYGCKKCVKTHQYTTEEWIELAKSVHGDKYDYSKVEYINNHTEVCIICPKHGEFWQKPSCHLRGRGCQKCAEENVSKKFSCSTEEFIEKSRERHGNKYDYSKVKYVNNSTKVCIICPVHGEFWQTPDSHLRGKGCPKCNSSHIENDIRLMLENNNITFEEQKTFDWLTNKGNLYIDFYLPKLKIAIECQGIQHFKVINRFDGKKGFEIRQKNDYIKFQKCSEKGIKVLYYTDVDGDYEYFSELIKDKTKLLELLKE